MMNRITVSRRGFTALLAGVASSAVVASTGCGGEGGGARGTSPAGASSTAREEDDAMLTLSIDDRDVDVAWEGNETVRALAEAVSDGPLDVQMSMYGGFEQVGGLDLELPRNDERITTAAGDIVLYSGNQVVVFYGSNTWEYTRLGRIQGMSDDELGALLGSGDVRMTFSTSAAVPGGHEIPDIVLNSGHAMPVIGLGTWTLSNEQAEESTYAALQCGMRLIDTARYYRCEAGVGRGIARAIDEGLVSRGDVFVTSKIMPSDYERAAAGIDGSLADLGLDYLDLMLIHQPGSNDEAVYRAMEQAVSDGRIRSIGISNYYTLEQVDEVLSFASIVPAVIQNENHLFYQNAELKDHAAQQGTVIESWYPFGGRGHTQESFGNETVTEIAGAHGKTPAQTILRWHVQAGYIAIPGSSNPDHIRENVDIFDFELSADEMSRMRELDEQRRYENW